MSAISSKKGTAPFIYGEATYETGYEIFGDLKNTDKSRRPLILLHGGPGIPSMYLATHADLTTNFNIPIVLYDQIGCGNSTHLPEKGADFWTPDLMCDQLEQLLKHLGVSECYDMYGHSWGGVLAAYFAGTRKPSGLVRLIINGAPVSFPLGVKNLITLLNKFPERLRDEIWKHENREPFDEAIFAEACQMWAEKHVCQVKPPPEIFIQARKEFEKDKTVNNYMEGDLEFFVTGTLKDFSLIPYLPDIKATTLLLNSEDDMVQDSCFKQFFDYIPKAKWIHYMKDCSHTPFYEIREKYMQDLANFLLA